MSYSPITKCVYLKAMAGCLSGLGATGKFLLDPTAGDYGAYGRMADAYAQKFDMTWGTADASGFELDAILENSEAVWETRSPMENRVAFSPDSYGGLVNGVIALVRQGKAQLVTQGIDPNGCNETGPVTLVGILYVDPQGTYGGSDSSPPTGNFTNPLTGGAYGPGPIFKTYNGGPVARWGTTGPRIRSNTQVVFVSSHTDDSDPVYFGLIRAEHGAVVSLESLPDTVATGVVLSSVVSKNRPGNQLLNADLGALAAVGQIVRNTTHAAPTTSTTTIYKPVGESGTVFALFQPTLFFAGIVFPADNWVNGDHVNLLQPLNVNLVEASATVADHLATVASNNVFVRNLTIYDPHGGSDFLLGAKISLENVVCQRNLIFNALENASNSTGRNVQVLHAFAGGVQVGGQGGTAFSFYGGGFDPAAFQKGSPVVGVSFDYDCILQSMDTFNEGDFVNATPVATYWIGNVYIETGAIVTQGGNGQIRTFGGAHGFVWGAGQLNAGGTGHIVYEPGADPTTIFIGTNPNQLLINLQTTASSVVDGSPSVINGGIALTPAALAAAAGVAGFGGNAFRLGGGSISNLP